MGLVEIKVVDVKAAAKKLGEPREDEEQIDIAIRNSAEKNDGGKITVPSQLGDRVQQLLDNPPKPTAALPPIEQPVVDTAVDTPESDDELEPTDPADSDLDD
jgi:hypothetical protein